MRLISGEEAPIFKVNDINEIEINLKKYLGKKVMISFYRYAACPFCNLRVHELVKNSELFKKYDLELIAFFESPKKSILQYAGKREVPFPIIADPNLIIYKKYKVESSWFGFLGGMMIEMPKMIKAMSKGFLPGKLEGDKALMPVDFLIDEDGTIYTAFYGNNLGDHLPISKIEEWLTGSIKKKAG